MLHVAVNCRHAGAEDTASQSDEWMMNRVADADDTVNTSAVSVDHMALIALAFAFDAAGVVSVAQSRAVNEA